jgi:hypothetical protein
MAGTRGWVVSSSSAAKPVSTDAPWRHTRNKGDTIPRLEDVLKDMIYERFTCAFYRMLLGIDFTRVVRYQNV